MVAEWIKKLHLPRQIIVGAITFDGNSGGYRDGKCCSSRSGIGGVDH